MGITKGGHPFSTYTKFFEKITFLTYVCVSGGKKCLFSKKFAYVLNWWPKEGIKMENVLPCFLIWSIFELKITVTIICKFFWRVLTELSSFLNFVKKSLRLIHEDCLCGYLTFYYAKLYPWTVSKLETNKGFHDFRVLQEIHVTFNCCKGVWFPLCSFPMINYVVFEVKLTVGNYY